MTDLDIYGKEAYLFRQDTLSTDETKAPPVPDEVLKLKLHATTGYSVTRSSNMTTQPVSDSSNRADHYTNNVEQVRLSGVIADHFNPFRLEASQRTSRDYVEEIKRLQDEKQWITVVLPEIGLYKNCMITSFTPSRKSQTGLGTEVSLSLQVLLVATVGEVSRVKVTEEDLMSAKQDQGGIGIGESEDSIYKNLKTLDEIDFMQKLIDQQNDLDASLIPTVPSNIG